MLIAFNGVVFFVAQRAYDIDALKLFPALAIFDYCPSRGAGIFTLQIRVYAALIDINALVCRNSFYSRRVLGAFALVFFVIGKSLFFRVMPRFFSA